MDDKKMKGAFVDKMSGAGYFKLDGSAPGGYPMATQTKSVISILCSRTMGLTVSRLAEICFGCSLHVESVRRELEGLARGGLAMEIGGDEWVVTSKGRAPAAIEGAQ